MAKQKQARAMDQYDAAMAQGKEDIQEYNKRMWDAGAGIAGLGMKAAMQGVSGLPKLNQAAGPTQMGDAPNMAFGAKHRPAVAQQVAMAPMAQRVALKTNSTTPWDPATPVWMR